MSTTRTSEKQVVRKSCVCPSLRTHVDSTPEPALQNCDSTQGHGIRPGSALDHLLTPLKSLSFLICRVLFATVLTLWMKGKIN